MRGLSQHIMQSQPQNSKKLWNSVCITLFELSCALALDVQIDLKGTSTCKNMEIFDRRVYFSNSLYYKNEPLLDVNDTSFISIVRIQ